MYSRYYLPICSTVDEDFLSFCRLSDNFLCVQKLSSFIGFHLLILGALSCASGALFRKFSPGAMTWNIFPILFLWQFWHIRFPVEIFDPLHMCFVQHERWTSNLILFLGSDQFCQNCLLNELSWTICQKLGSHCWKHNI